MHTHRDLKYSVKSIYLVKIPPEFSEVLTLNAFAPSQQVKGQAFFKKWVFLKYH